MKSAARIVKQKRSKSIRRRVKRKKIRSLRKNLMMKAMKSEPNSRRRRIRKIRRKRNVQTLTVAIAMRIRRRKRKRIKRARRTRRIRKSLIKRKWLKQGCRPTMMTWSKLPCKLSNLVFKSQQGRLKTILNRSCRLSTPGNKRRTKRRRRKRVVHQAALPALQVVARTDCNHLHLLLEYIFY